MREGFFHFQKEEVKGVGAGGMKLGVQHQAPIASSVSVSSHMTATSKSQNQATSSDGWGFDDSEWGTFDAQPSQSAGVGASGQSKQELLQKRREERRLKQQAAREKRAAGTGLKPSGLGAVKKD